MKRLLFTVLAVTSVTCDGAEAPSISCPPNIITRIEPGTCRARVLYALPVATGTPTPVVHCEPPTGSVFGGGTTQGVLCTATNIAGASRCAFTVTVVDDEPPVIACPDICLTSDLGLCAATSFGLPRPQVADNCGEMPPGTTNRLTVVNDAPEILPWGTSIVTWTATDASGNRSTCQQRVTMGTFVDVIFLPPLDDLTGNERFRAGQTMPVRVELRDCIGQLITSGVTAKVKLQGLEDDEFGRFVFDEVVEQARGNGISGSAETDGTMVLRGSHYYFNLDTRNLADANTAANLGRIYQMTIMVTDDATGCLGSNVNLAWTAFETVP